MTTYFPAPYRSSIQIDRTLPQVHTSSPFVRSEAFLGETLKATENVLSKVEQALISSERMHARGAFSNFQIENIQRLQEIKGTQNPEQKGFDQLEETALKDYEKRASEQASKMSSKGRELFLSEVESQKASFYEKVLLNKTNITHEYGLDKLKEMESNNIDMIMADPSNDNFNALSKTLKESIGDIPGFNSQQREKAYRDALNRLAHAQSQGSQNINPSVGAEWARQVLNVKKLGKVKSVLHKKPHLSPKSLAVMSAETPTGKKVAETPVSVENPSVKDLIRNSEVKSLDYVTAEELKKEQITPPFEGWKHLTLEQKIDFVNKSFTKEAENSKTLGTQYYDTLLKAETLVRNGQNPRKLFESTSFHRPTVTLAFGEKHTQDIYDKIDELIEMGDFTDKIKTMPYAQAHEYLVKQKPTLTGGEDDQRKLRVYEWQKNAFDNINAVIAKNPLEWMKSVGYGGVKELSPKIEDSLLELPQRSLALQQLEKEKQLPSSSILDAKDTELLKDQFNRMGSLNAFQYIKNLHSQMEGASFEHFKDIAIKLGDNDLVTVAEIGSLPSSRSAGNDPGKVAFTLLSGSRIRKNNSVLTKIQAEFDSYFNQAMNIPTDVPLSPENSERLDRIRSATLNYMAGSNLSTFHADTKSLTSIQKAVKQVIGGGFHKFHGSMLLAPWGMEKSEFIDKLDIIVRERLAKEFTPTSGKSNILYTDPSQYKYEQVRQGLYMAVAPTGAVVLGKDGIPLFFDVSKAPELPGYRLWGVRLW